MIKNIFIPIWAAITLTGCLKIKDGSSTPAAQPTVSPATQTQPAESKTDLTIPILEKKYKTILHTVVAHNESTFLSNLSIQKNLKQNEKQNQISLNQKARYEYVIDIRFNNYKIALDNLAIHLDNNLSLECKDRENFTNRCKWHLYTRVLTRIYSGITYSTPKQIEPEDLKIITPGVFVNFTHPDGYSVSCSLDDLEANTSVFNSVFSLTNKPKCQIFPDTHSQSNELSITLINNINHPDSLKQIADGKAFRSQIVETRVDAAPESDLSELGQHQINLVEREFLIQPTITYQYLEKLEID